MDYDDNDFHSQNFQLVGEDNNKFPSGLRTFALPNFDLDEHLQVNLRFDSLVEPDDLLRIPVQEDGNWIENFSPGNSAIEFSSNAAESCSISRHNNVWSEATSSESVEMLLKSVGEDDMMEKKTITEPNTDDVLNNMENKLNTLTKNDSLHPKMEDPLNAEPAAQHDQCDTGIRNDVMNVQSSMEVEYNIPTDEKLDREISVGLVGGSLGDEKLVSGHSGFNEKLISSPFKSVADDNLVEKTSSDKSLHKGSEDDNLLDHFHLVEVAAGDCVVGVLGKPSLDSSRPTSVLDVVVSAQPSYQNTADHVKEECAKDSFHKKSIMETCQQGKGQTRQTGMDEGIAVESSFCTLGNPSDLETQVDSGMLSLKGCSQSAYSMKSDGLLEVIVGQDKISNDGNGTGKQVSAVQDGKAFVVLEDVCKFKGHSVEMNKEDAGKSAISVPEITPPSEAAGVNNVGSHEKLSEFVHVREGRELEASAIVMEEKQDSGAHQVANNADKEDFSSSVGKVHGLINEAGETQISNMESEKLGKHDQEVLDKSAGVELDDDRNSEGLLTDLGETNITEMQASAKLDITQKELCQEGTVGPVSHENDVILSRTFVSEECSRSCTVSGSVNPVSDGCVVVEKKEATSIVAANPSSVTDLEVSMEKKIIHDETGLTAGVPSSSAGLASSVGSEDTNRTLFEDASASDVVVENKKPSAPILLASDSILSDKDGGKSSQISNKPHSPILEDDSCSHTASLHVPGSGSEQMYLRVPVQVQPTVVVKSSTNPDSAQVAVAPCNELPSSADGTTMVEHATPLEVQPIAASVLKDKGDSEELGSRKSDEETSGNSGSTSSKFTDEPNLVDCKASSLNSSEANCCSPTVISCSEHCHDEMANQKGNKVLTEQSLSISGDIPCTSTNKDNNSNRTESTTGNPKENNVFDDDKSFTFEVGHLSELPEKDAANGWKPFSSTQSFETTQPEQETSTKSDHQSDSSLLEGTNQGSQLVSSKGQLHDVVSKSAGKDKRRLATPCTSASKRKSLKDKVNPKKTTERIDTPITKTVNSFGSISRDLQLEEMRQYSSADGRSMKPSCSVVPTSNLPDLNTSASAPALFNQPFTDSQQVQLRAQIFVYGSLIQGIPPDEACMVSAFGDVDGGKSTWENVWRAVAEKYDNQKSPLASCETPASRPVMKAPDQASRSSPIQSKVINATPGRTSNKGPPSTIFSPISLPSPVWSISTRDKLHPSMSRGTNLDTSQILSPLHAYQSPHIRQFASSGAPWLTHSPSPVPWVAPPHSSPVDTSTQISVLPVTEAVQVTPNRESSLPHVSNIQFMSPNAFPAAGGVVSVSAASTMQNDSSRKDISTGTKKPVSTDQKSRRRKKGTVPEVAHGQMPSVSRPQLELVPAAEASKSISFPTPANPPSRASSGGLVSTISPIISPTHFQIVGSGRGEQRIIFSEETSSKIEQAKLQAEDAASFAAAAVRHSEGIWSQLAAQKNSGVVSEVEWKLASAAVAAAAAAAVAKAASAAAKVAADSALQAKLMADEAMVSGRAGKAPQSSETDHLYGGNNLAMVSPASILKGKDKTSGSYSIIPAAREAARKRVEAASAAAKRAENLDAIVKAAELAAEAVSQAGAIVAMGDPLPFTLSEILEAGPEAYWKTQHSSVEQPVKTNSMHGGKEPIMDKADCHNQSDTQLNELPLIGKQIRHISEGENIHSSNELSRRSAENYTGISSVSVGDGKEQLAADLNENSIQEGSLVEVMSDAKGLGGVWYAARVLKLKDSQAHVCYNELLTDDGSIKMKEWISLESEGERAPRIRLAHPMTTAKSEGPRKRRRAVSGTYLWAVGDRVDAWISDGWREGVITEKSKEDETKFIVHFPAGGDSSVVRSWDLRLSLVWKDGQWMEWCRSHKSALEHHEGDTPQQKRQKLNKADSQNNSEVEGVGASRISRSLRSDLRKPEEFVPLGLSAKDKIFSFGKVIREENNSDRIKRTGLQKEGSKVVFGIPKPGKKRKFMDVSKHCVVENTEKIREGANIGKTRDGNDPMKFAKYLMPQTSNGWKNVSKVDSRSKRAADLKPKPLKSVKSRNAPTRGLADKEILAGSNDEGIAQGPLASGKPSAALSDKKLEKKNILEVGSFASSMGTVDGPLLPAQLQPTSGVPSTSMSASDVEAEHAEKGKHARAIEKSVRNEDKVSHLSDMPGKTISETNEPRRSNRRIQPTSRLLEGLQSSLIIAKIPSVHDKSSKASHRSGSSSRGHTHG